MTNIPRAEVMHHLRFSAVRYDGQREFISGSPTRRRMARVISTLTTYGPRGTTWYGGRRS